MIEFFAEQGLTRGAARRVLPPPARLLADRFDALGAPEHVISRDRSAPLTSFGGFLALRTPHAAELQKQLHDGGVQTDSRGDYLRLGPAPYLSDAQLEASHRAAWRRARRLA